MDKAKQITELLNKTEHSSAYSRNLFDWDADCVVYDENFKFKHHFGEITITNPFDGIVCSDKQKTQYLTVNSNWFWRKEYDRKMSFNSLIEAERYAYGHFKEIILNQFIKNIHWINKPLVFKKTGEKQIESVNTLAPIKINLDSPDEIACLISNINKWTVSLNDDCIDDISIRIAASSVCGKYITDCIMKYFICNE